MAKIARRSLLISLVCLGLALWSGQGAQAQSDPLPSWNDGATKKSITDFVARVTTQGGPDFVPMDERIAHSTTTARCGLSSRCMCNWLSSSIV